MLSFIELIYFIPVFKLFSFYRIVPSVSLDTKITFALGTEVNDEAKLEGESRMEAKSYDCFCQIKN